MEQEGVDVVVLDTTTKEVTVTDLPKPSYNSCWFSSFNWPSSSSWLTDSCWERRPFWWADEISKFRRWRNEGLDEDTASKSFKVSGAGWSEMEPAKSGTGNTIVFLPAVVLSILQKKSENNFFLLSRTFNFLKTFVAYFWTGLGDTIFFLLGLPMTNLVWRVWVCLLRETGEVRLFLLIPDNAAVFKTVDV